MTGSNLDPSPALPGDVDPDEVRELALFLNNHVSGYRGCTGSEDLAARIIAAGYRRSPGDVRAARYAREGRLELFRVSGEPPEPVVVERQWLAGDRARVAAEVAGYGDLLAEVCTCPPPEAGGIVGVNRGHLLGCPELHPGQADPLGWFPPAAETPRRTRLDGIWPDPDARPTY